MKICERCGFKGMKGFSKSKKFGKLLCRKCYYYFSNLEIRLKKYKNNLCLNCGKKITPITCPHCEKIISYRKRCEKCLEKLRK